MDQSVRDQYRALGFVLVPGLVSPEDLITLRAEADAFVRPSEDIRTWGGDWRAEYGEAGQRFTLWSRHGVHALPGWGRFVTASPLVDTAKALIGPSARLHQTTAVFKPADTGQAFPLHQDAQYYGDGFKDYVIAVVHLDDTTPANGPLRFFPGVQTRGKLVHTGQNKPSLDPVKYPPDRLVEVCAQAGDVVLFSLYTPHGSSPNTTDRVRRTVRCGFCVEN